MLSNSEYHNARRSHALLLSSVVFAGACSVGKSALIERVMYDCAPAGSATIFEEYTHVHRIDERTCVPMRVRDTAGMSEYVSLVQEQMIGANVVVCVFDVSRASTLRHIDQCTFDLLSAANSYDYARAVPIILCGNRIDEVHGADTVTRQRVQEWMAQQRFNIVAYHETSALDVLSVQRLFDECARQLTLARPRPLLSLQSLRHSNDSLSSPSSSSSSTARSRRTARSEGTTACSARSTSAVLCSSRSADSSSGGGTAYDPDAVTTARSFPPTHIAGDDDKDTSALPHLAPRNHVVSTTMYNIAAVNKHAQSRRQRGGDGGCVLQ